MRMYSSEGTGEAGKIEKEGAQGPPTLLEGVGDRKCATT